MLLWLVGRWSQHADWGQSLAAWEKITLRASLAAAVSFLLALLLGPRLIGWLAGRFQEPNQSDSPQLRRLHENKHRTPTMGGLFIVGGIVAALLLLADLGNLYVQLALTLTVALALLGAVDDLTKLAGRRGLSAKTKLAGQVAVAAAVACILWKHHALRGDTLALTLPAASLELGGWFVPLAVLVMVGSSNAVNLADGLDGLAGGCLLLAAGALALIAYVGGHVHLAEYLGVPHVAGCGELVLACGAMMGAVLGFLWFNCHPAQVFMGDTGSLPLGGLLGLVAVVARQELLLVVVAGVFVAEALSVIAQVGWYRLSGRRLLRCAPLHHHFQLLGWPESKIVVRFWIAAAVCALLGVAALKVNVPSPADIQHLAGRPSSVQR